MFLARKLVLAHFWVAFVAFLRRDPARRMADVSCAARCAPWVNNPEHYYRSVTAHGTVMAYVLPTLVAMGFGYAICELALKRPLDRLALGVGRLLAGRRRHGDRRGDDGASARRRCSTRSIRR